MPAQLVEDYRQRIRDIAARHGAHDLRVFGSLARSEGGAGSDLDLLINLEEGRSLLDLIALKHDLEDLLGRPVDVVTERSLSPFLRETVLQQAVEL